MEQLKQTLAPLLNRVSVDLGGSAWLFIICAIALVFLLPLAWRQRRFLRVLVPRRRPRPMILEEPPDEDLASYPSLAAAPPGTVEPVGQRRLLIEGVPARLRLVVIAPLGTAGTISDTSAQEILNQVLWGLGGLIAQDRPRVRIWPPQLSAHGFGATFHRHVHRPEAEGQPSHWILMAGPTPGRPRVYCLGLVLWTDEATTIGRLNMDPAQWVTFMRLEAVEGREPQATPAAASGLSAPPRDVREVQPFYAGQPEVLRERGAPGNFPASNDRS